MEVKKSWRGDGNPPGVKSSQEKLPNLQGHRTIDVVSPGKSYALFELFPSLIKGNLPGKVENN